MMKKNKMIIKVLVLTIAILLGNRWVLGDIISLDLPYEPSPGDIKYKYLNK